MTTKHPNRPRCPACGSLTVRWRMRAEAYICIRCGESWDRPRASHEVTKKT